MTEQERKKIMNLADTIKGEINRLCVTKELSELDSMAIHVKRNIEKLQSMWWNGDFRKESKCQC